MHDHIDITVRPLSPTSYELLVDGEVLAPEAVLVPGEDIVIELRPKGLEFRSTAYRKTTSLVRPIGPSAIGPTATVEGTQGGGDSPETPSA